MVEALVRAHAIRWTDDSFPGWIEVTLIDAAGREHVAVDKVPIFTELDIRPDTEFPVELWLQADAATIDGERVTAVFKWIETRDGLSEVVVTASDVRWL